MPDSVVDASANEITVGQSYAIAGYVVGADGLWQPQNPEPVEVWLTYACARCSVYGKFLEGNRARCWYCGRYVKRTHVPSMRTEWTHIAAKCKVCLDTPEDEDAVHERDLV